MKMRKVLFVASILFLLAFSQAFAFTNLVQNSSFENGEGLPSDWIHSDHGATCQVSWSNVSHTGNSSFLLNSFSGGGSVAVASVPVAVSPGGWYTASAWVKAEELLAGKVYLALTFYQGERSVERYLFVEGNFPISSSTDWQQLLATGVAPKDAQFVSIELIAEGINSTAKVYFDDIAVFENPKGSAFLKTTKFIPGPTSQRVRADGAFGNNATVLVPGLDPWTTATFSLPSGGTLPIGEYSVWCRYLGLPQTASIDQAIKPLFWSESKGDLVWSSDSIVSLPAKVDGNAHYAGGIVKVEGEVVLCGLQIMNLFKPTSPGSTNLVDWIWIGPKGAMPPEGELVIMEAPKSLSAQYAGVNNVQLTWNPPTSNSGIAAYQVYRGTKAGFAPSEGVLLGSTMQTNFVAQLDQSSEMNYFKVIAWNSVYGGYGSPAAETQIRSDHIPPNSPENVQAQVRAEGVVAISWEHSGPAADGDLAVGYRIYQLGQGQDVSNGKLILEITNFDQEFSSCQVLDRGVPTGSFRYAMVALDKWNNPSQAAESNSVAVEEDKYPPETPKVLTAWVDQDADGSFIPKGAVLLRWSAVELSPHDGDGALCYLIYRSQSPEPKNSGQVLLKIPALTEPEFEYMDVTPQGGIKYYYAITALDKALNESVSSPVAGATPGIAPVPVAMNPVDGMPIRENQALLTWEQVEPIADTLLCYSVELARDLEFGRELKKIQVGAGNTKYISYLYPQALNTGVWYWRVKAVYSSGVQSEYSAVGKFTILDLENQQMPLDLYASLSPKFFSAKGGEQVAINLVVGVGAELSIKIYNLEGRIIKRLVESMVVMPNTPYELSWNGYDYRGFAVKNGIYLISIEAKTEKGTSRQVRRVQVYN